jgi:hypothetical protein
MNDFTAIMDSAIPSKIKVLFNKEVYIIESNGIIDPFMYEDYFKIEDIVCDKLQTDILYQLTSADKNSEIKILEY